MKKRLQELTALIKGKLDEHDDLVAKAESEKDDAKCAEMLKKAGELATEAESLQKEAETAKSAIERSEKVRAFVNDPILPSLVKDGGDRGGDEDPDVRKQRSGARQTALVEITLNGNPRVIDFDTLDMSEKTFNALCEPSYEKALLRSVVRSSQGKEAEKADLAELKSVQAGLDVQGGALVPPQWIAEMISPDPALSELPDIVTTQLINSDKVQWPKNTYSQDNANDKYTNPFRKVRTGETGSPSDAGQPVLGTKEIGVYEGSIEVAMTRSMLMNSAIDIRSYILQELRSSFRLDTDAEIAAGDGINKPLGILTNAGAGANNFPTVNVGHPVTADGLIDLVYTVPRQYRGADMRVVMEDLNLYRTLAKIKDTDGNYIFGLFKNTDGGLATPRGEVLLGKPITFSSFYNTGGSAQNIMSIGNHRRAYVYALRMGMTIDFQDHPRDPFVYAVLRFWDGGDTVQPRALRVGVQS